MRYIALLFAFLFAGCSLKSPPLDTVAKVDINRYLGTWYEIARYEHSFEVGCDEVSATYSLRDDGDIKVLNKCTLQDGTKKEATGVAYATDTTNSKLKVSFFRPFYGNYWILMLADDYSYAVIGEPKREYFWILSREAKMDEQSLQKVLDAMPKLGYKQELLIWTKHNKTH
jgi:apolipoprotein D and lipocalin family protein